MQVWGCDDTLSYSLKNNPKLIEVPYQIEQVTMQVCGCDIVTCSV